MKIIIAGSRDIPADISRPLICLGISLLATDPGFKVERILVGGAKGVDQAGLEFAMAMGIEYVMYLADWERYGKRAGPIRNAAMVADGDALVAVWNGKSRCTADIIRKAYAAGLRVSPQVVVQPRTLLS